MELQRSMLLMLGCLTLSETAANGNSVATSRYISGPFMTLIVWAIAAASLFSPVTQTLTGRSGCVP